MASIAMAFRWRRLSRPLRRGAWSNVRRLDIVWSKFQACPRVVAMWSVQEAKTKLSQIMQKALAGEPQVIGRLERCVVISIAEYQRLKKLEEEPHLGRWVGGAPHGPGE